MQRQLAIVKRDSGNYREANVKSAIGNDPSFINPVNLLTCQLSLAYFLLLFLQDHRKRRAFP